MLIEAAPGRRRERRPGGRGLARPRPRPDAQALSDHRPIHAAATMTFATFEIMCPFGHRNRATGAVERRMRNAASPFSSGLRRRLGGRR